MDYRAIDQKKTSCVHESYRGKISTRVANCYDFELITIAFYYNQIKKKFSLLYSMKSMKFYSIYSDEIYFNEFYFKFFN